ncbi:monocarboxylate transporter 12-like isoform X2 [Patiria miniata]|uniref:Major facilitator superfamily (MFS) profile domain-containing protein n=1 Tax=Patiria miniata TaxID=46514 RepID=A0A914A8Z9_PATMI|nr:monocarboxylate transporter 12-like isoform X2 [Patiria miniata]
MAGSDASGSDARAGWFAVLAMWTRAFIWSAVIKVISMTLPLLQDQFDTTTWILGWVTSFIGTATGLFAITSRLMGRWFRPGYVIMTCGAMIGGSVIMASFANSPAHLACVFILLLGTGFGISSVLIKEAIARCFATNYATATGIARTGDSIGLFVCAPIIQVFIDTYGWRGAMLLVGAISMHLVVCGALMMRAGAPSASRYQKLSANDGISEHPSQLPSRCTSFYKNLLEIFDIRLLSDFRYWSVAIIACCSKFAFHMWLIYFVSQAKSNGFSLQEAATFVTVGGVGGLIAKLVQGFFLDRGVMSSFHLTAIAVAICSASYCATPWLTSYWPMMTSSLLIVTSSGALCCLQDVLSKQVLGVDLLVGAFGWTAFAGAILQFSLGYLPGWLFDTTGSYTTAFVFIGSMQFLPMFPLLILRYYRCLERDARGELK